MNLYLLFGARLAFHKFENQERRTIDLLQIVDCGNARMIQRGQNFGLALKPRQAIRITRKLVRQDLDGATSRPSLVSCA